MIQAFDLSYLSRARVWQAVDPFDGSARPTSIAIELLVPRGPRSEYALLGGSVHQDLTGILVRCPEDQGRWQESLVADGDEVRRGLPLEYREAVLREGSQAALEQSVRGAIAYDCAAHGSIGSSPALFGRLAAAIVTLLASPERAANEDYVRKLLEEARKA